MQVAGERFQFNAPAGRFRVLEGRRIIVDARPAAAAEVRLYLLGTAVGALLHQQPRRLPLHAAAIAWGDGAVAFAGPSGAGKSTLAAQWLRAGHTVLADDLCAVDAGEAGVGRPPPRMSPGLARIKLWPDALAMADLDEGGLTPLAPSTLKLALATPAPAQGALPLRRLYVLRPGGDGTVAIRRLSGPEAVAAVLESVYRWPVAVAMGRAAAQLSACVAIAGACEVFETIYALDADKPLRLWHALIRNLATDL
jgi:hypothetical protein